MMKFDNCLAARTWGMAALAACALLAQPRPAAASEFSVTPIRVELKPGVLSETISVTNHSTERLRVSVRLVEWSQDAGGADIYKESSDLVYFPRQLEMEPNGKRLVRVGVKAPAGTVERTYRLFIEEEPPANAGAARAQVAFYFRFGVPVFLPPAVATPQPEVMEPVLGEGKLSVTVRNAGNQHFRLTKVLFDDGAGFSREVAGWYSLAGTQRTYTADIPADICRKARAFNVTLEGDGIRFDRKVNVDPSRCL